MADFDPYYRWLGIPPEEQPADYYRLLGLPRFVSNLDVIENAADRQMAHVRTFQAGKHSEASQRLLNELAAARVCLLDDQAKAVYDAQLNGGPADSALPSLPTSTATEPEVLAPLDILDLAADLESVAPTIPAAQLGTVRQVGRWRTVLTALRPFLKPAAIGLGSVTLVAVTLLGVKMIVESDFLAGLRTRVANTLVLEAGVEVDPEIKTGQEDRNGQMFRHSVDPGIIGPQGGPSSGSLAVARKPGVLLWKFETGAPVTSSPAVGLDGTVYVAAAQIRSVDGVGNTAPPKLEPVKHLYALDGRTGEVRWSEELGGGLSSPAVWGFEDVYVGAGGKLYALNSKTGVVKWNFGSSASAGSSPVLGAAGTVYFAVSFRSRLSRPSAIYEVDATSGDSSGKFYVDESGDLASPVIGADGTLYVGSSNGKLYAVDIGAEKLKWEFQTQGALSASPAIDADGTVYIGSADKYLYAVDGKTGTMKWKYETAGPISSSVATGDAPRNLGGGGAAGDPPALYVGSSDANVYAIFRRTGRLQWVAELGSAVLSSPAVGADGTLYVGANDNKLHALDSKTGKHKWIFGTGNALHSSPVIGAYGTVYVGSTDGKVYALATASGGLATSSWPMWGRNPQHTGRAGRANQLGGNKRSGFSSRGRNMGMSSPRPPTVPGEAPQAGGRSLASPASPLPGSATRNGQRLPRAQRLPVPERLAQDRARADLREGFSEQYAKIRALTGKVRRQALQTLAQELYALLAEETDATSRYVLLSTANRISVESGDPVLTYRIIDDLSRHYEIDDLPLRVAAVTSWSTELPAHFSGSQLVQMRGQLLALIRPLAQRADRQYRYIEAADLYDLAAQQVSAESDRHQEFLRLGEEAGGKAERYTAMRELAEELAGSGTPDPRKSQVLGSYWCFEVGDWEQGLSWLAKSSASVLAETAAFDRSNTGDLEAAEEVGNRWWELATRPAVAKFRAAMQARAAHWYALALPGKTGLLRKKLEQRITEAGFTIDQSGGIVPMALLLPANLKQGLIAYYPFNGDAQDGSGNHNHGTVHGDPQSTQDRHGNVNEAYAFDGRDDYISAPSRSYLNFPNGYFTISMWASIQTLRAPIHFIGKDTGGGPKPKWIFHYGGPRGRQLTLHVYPPDNAFIAAAPVPTSYGSWHHYVAIKDGRRCSIYVDGRQASRSNVSVHLPQDNSAPLTMGQAEGGGWLHGTLDDVRIYNRALSAAEVNQLHEFERTDPSGRLSNAGATPTPTSAPRQTGSTRHPNFKNTVNPVVKKMVLEGIGYLENHPETRPGHKALMALAMLTVDKKYNTNYKSSSFVQQASKECTNVPTSDVKAVYQLSVALLLLCELDAKQHRQAIQSMLRRLASLQRSDGSWSYPQRNIGDTSCTAWGVLAFWTAYNTGGAKDPLTVDRGVLERACKWLLRTQDLSGAWSYLGKDSGGYNRIRQDQDDPPGQNAGRITPSLVTSGLGGIYMAAQVLGIENHVTRLSDTGKKKDARNEVAAKTRQPAAAHTIDMRVLRRSLRDGEAYFRRRCAIESHFWQASYLYALERHQALREFATGHFEDQPNWYNQGVAFLQRTQNEGGGWDLAGNEENNQGEGIDTAFSILFLLRATGDLVQTLTDGIPGN